MKVIHLMASKYLARDFFDSWKPRWLDGGTWAVSGGYAYCTPNYKPEQINNGTFDTNTTGWSNYTGSFPYDTFEWQSGTIHAVSDGVKNADNYCCLYQNANLSMVVGQWYKLEFTITVNSGAAPTVAIQNNSAMGGVYKSFGYTSGVKSTTIFRYDGTGNKFFSVYNLATSAADFNLDNVSFKRMNDASSFSLSLQPTTDILVDMALHNRTLGTQVGVAQSDRSFAAQCASTALAGQAVIALKEIGDQTATGLTTNDTITIAGTTYTIASITGGSNVAYNNTTKTQTVTLGSNLSGDVAVDAKVGLNWASWNGASFYFDGAGNIKVDEIKAGISTNRASNACTWSADKIMQVTKNGGTYTIKFDSIINATVTTIDAAARVGRYWGMFSTDSTNTIKSFNIDKV